MGWEVTASAALEVPSASGMASTVNRSRQDDEIDCTEIRKYLVELQPHSLRLRAPGNPTRGRVSRHGTARFVSYETPIQTQELVLDRCWDKRWDPLEHEGYRPPEVGDYRRQDPALLERVRAFQNIHGLATYQ